MTSVIANNEASWKQGFLETGSVDDRKKTYDENKENVVRMIGENDAISIGFIAKRLFHITIFWIQNFERRKIHN